MASAAIWLDELGIPPREICLDWAWQIQSRFSRAHRTTSIAPLDWQRIDVGDDGELLLPADFEKYSPDARLQELLSWSQGHNSSSVSSAFDERVNIEAELKRLTVDCVSKIATVRSRNTTHALPVSNKESLQEPSEPESDTVTNTFAPTDLTSSNLPNRAKFKRSKSSITEEFLAVCKQHRLAAASIGFALVATCIVALSSMTGSAPTSKPIEVTHQQSNVHGEANIASQGTDVDESAALATLPVMPELDVGEPAVQEVSPIQLPTVSSVAISGLDRKEEPAASNMSGDRSSENESEQNSPPSVANPTLTRNEPAPASDAELTDHDVMQELEVMTKSAKNNAIETDLNVVDSQDENTISEPFTVHTSPMVQTHKVAAKIKVRPRQPVWQIVLAVDDEFDLSPEEPQDISDRQPTTWILTNTDSKSPQVRLVIQAQAAPGRQTSLRWRIFASAEDLPDLMLPLDDEMLNPLQERLRFYAQASQREADRLKQLASVAERDMRNTLSKQRVFMESQSKLASRLTTVVAEAQLMNDLLRSQLTVYAKLRDGTEANAPTLLQFGDLRELEKAREATEPAAVSE